MSQVETTESVVALPEPVALSAETATTREELTEKIVATKLAKDLTWEELAEALGRR